MEYKGIIVLNDGQEVVNPTLTIKNISIECEFIGDDGLPYTRWHQLECNKSNLNSVNIQEGIDKDIILNKFK